MEESKHWTINEVPCKEYVAGCEVHHKELKYGSVNLHLVQCGNLEGELVLLLHGFPNFWYAWKNQLNMLKSAGYHIIAPDLRVFIQIPWLPEWCLSLDRFNALRKSLPASFPVEDVDKYVQAWSKPGSLRGGLNYYRAALRGYWAGNQTDSVVDVPVTVIWGVLDEYLGHELANLPKLKFIKSVILRCPKASHWPMWDDPEDFNSKLLYALNRND
eukprot:TRINITY_DN11676_c0_g1_i2.p1 TRINITY_DN11676_c0_g1~~TRINITY_DN11676_c0_g1_i2.p1  ORF type:complete len:215 (+),score=31.09 TRINITY_DN11676_c0_g1_i2:103-747(+)